MAITHVATVNAPGSTSADTSFSTNVPAGVRDGDLLIWELSANTATVAPTPTGWSVWTATTTTNLNSSSFYKLAASEPGSYTASGLTSARWGGSMSAYRGVHQTTQKDVANPSANLGTTTVTYPAITPVTAGAVIVAIGAHTEAFVSGSVQDATWTTSNLDALTGDAQSNTATTGNNVFIGTGYKAWSGSGSFTPNLTNSETKIRSIGISGALRPATFYDLTAAGTATSTGSAAITLTAVITASGTATSSGSAAITIVSGATTYDLTASGTAASTGSAALTLTAALTASGTATSTGSADATLTMAVAASGTATSSGSAAITIAPRTYDLTVAGAGTTSGSAAIALTMVVAAAGTATSSGSAALALILAVTASGSSTGSGSAALTLIVAPVTFDVTAAGTATTNGSAALTMTLAVTAAGDATCTGSAAYTMTLAVTAAGVATGTGSAACNVFATASATPAGRTVLILAENRVLAVGSDDRVLRVPADPRVDAVPAEYASS